MCSDPSTRWGRAHKFDGVHAAPPVVTRRARRGAERRGAARNGAARHGMAGAELGGERPAGGAEPGKFHGPSRVGLRPFGA